MNPAKITQEIPVNKLHKDIFVACSSRLALCSRNIAAESAKDNVLYEEFIVARIGEEQYMFFTTNTNLILMIPNDKIVEQCKKILAT